MGQEDQREQGPSGDVLSVGVDLQPDLAAVEVAPQLLPGGDGVLVHEDLDVEDPAEDLVRVGSRMGCITTSLRASICFSSIALCASMSCRAFEIVHEVGDALVDATEPRAALPDLGLAIAGDLAQVLGDPLADVGDTVARRQPVLDGGEQLRLEIREPDKNSGFKGFIVFPEEGRETQALQMVLRDRATHRWRAANRAGRGARRYRLTSGRRLFRIFNRDVPLVHDLEKRIIWKMDSLRLVLPNNAAHLLVTKSLPDKGNKP